MPTLRDQLDEFLKVGEAKVIDKEVEWNLEASAIGYAACRLDAPAPWMRKIKGITNGASLIGEPWAGTFRHPWRRIGMTMGLSPNASYEEFYGAVINRITQPIKPTVVST
ncbi:MAG: UbiD family decarboxylase, partial [Desulfatiglandales bacterium]|nr:UbiD family decarboxylase [Desulfatiglandales bacterium]